mmetsp:Transcript_21890/g.26614  ORF Transcript_21890/g.26614 Transcript_21890/m.26614 type:complete len:630 (-) Transcript_21890:2112-4001(-)
MNSVEDQDVKVDTSVVVEAAIAVSAADTQANVIPAAMAVVAKEAEADVVVKVEGVENEETDVSEDKAIAHSNESKLVRKTAKLNISDVEGSSSAEEDTGSGSNNYVSGSSGAGLTSSKNVPPVKLEKKLRLKNKPPAPTRRPPPPTPVRRTKVSRPVTTAEDGQSSPSATGTSTATKVVKFQNESVQFESIFKKNEISPESTLSPAGEKGKPTLETDKLLVGFKTPDSNANVEPPVQSQSTAKVDTTPSTGGFDSTMVMSPALRKSCMKAKKRSNRFRGLFTKKVPAMKWSSCEVAGWLELLGLEDYAERFLANGVDGSTLLELDTRQFAQGLGVTNECHIVSLELGVMQLILEKIDYDHWEWSAEKVQKWLTLRGFACLRECFREAAIHGGVLFNVEFKYFMEIVGVKKINKSPIFAESLALSIERAKTVGSRISEMSHNESPADIDGPGVFVVNEKAAESNHETIDVQDWGQNDIEQWLKKQHVGHLAKTFNLHGVNGTILLTLTRERMEKQMDLTEIQAIVLAKGLYRLKRMQRKGLGSFFRSKSTKKLTNSQSGDRLKLARAKSSIPVAQRIDFDVEMEVEMELAEIENQHSNNNSLTHKAKKFGDVLHKMRSVKSENNLERMND